MLLKSLPRIRSLALNQLLPARCGVCRGYGSLLCSRCVAALPLPAAGRRCDRCWLLCGTAICARCEAYGPRCSATRACFAYAGSAKQLVTAVKYAGLFALAEPMSRLMAERWHGFDRAVDVVVPVPLHPRRERWRGFNQSSLLAHGVADELRLPYDGSAIRRTRYTPPQVRATGEQERQANVYSAFACRDRRVAGARVLLVDDVTTTGATLGACAGALFEAGADSVYGFAFAIPD